MGQGAGTTCGAATSIATARAITADTYQFNIKLNGHDRFVGKGHINLFH